MARDTTVDKVAKGATPEEVEAAAQEALKTQHEATVADHEAQLARVTGNVSRERVYVEDEDGITRLAAAKNQPVPAWAEQMKQKTGGKSNEPKNGPDATA